MCRTRPDREKDKRETRTKHGTVPALLLLGWTLLLFSEPALFAQDDSARSVLNESLKNTFSPDHSFTVSFEQTDEMTYREMKRTFYLNTGGTVRRDGSFLSSTFNTEMSFDRGGGGRRQPLKQEEVHVIGKSEPDGTFFVKPGEQNWKNHSDLQSSSVLLRRMKQFYDARQFEQFFEEVQFDGIEQIDGEPCRKMTGTVDKERLKEHFQSRMRKRFSKRNGMEVTSLDVAVQSLDLFFWVDQQARVIRRFSLSLKQQFTIEARTGQGNRRMVITQVRRQTSDFTAHGQTRVKKSRRDTYRRLLSRPEGQGN